MQQSKFTKKPEQYSQSRVPNQNEFLIQGLPSPNFIDQDQRGLIFSGTIDKEISNGRSDHLRFLEIGRDKLTSLVEREIRGYNIWINNLCNDFSLEDIKNLKLVCKQFQETINSLCIYNETLLSSRCLVAINNIKQLLFVSCLTPLIKIQEETAFDILENRDVLSQILNYYPINGVCKDFQKAIPLKIENPLNEQLLTFKEYAKVRFAVDRNIKFEIKLKSITDIMEFISFIKDGKICLNNIEAICISGILNEDLKYLQNLLDLIFEKQSLFLSFKTLKFLRIGTLRQDNVMDNAPLNIPQLLHLENLEFIIIGIDLNFGYLPALKDLDYTAILYKCVEEKLKFLKSCTKFKDLFELSEIKLQEDCQALRFLKYLVWKKNEYLKNIKSISMTFFNPTIQTRLLKKICSKEKLLTSLNRIQYNATWPDSLLKNIKFPDNIKIELLEETYT